MMDYQISDNTYKSIFETNLDAILISNSKNKILDANPIAELLFGYSYNELIKLELSQLLDTTDLNLTVLLNRLSIKE